MKTDMFSSLKVIHGAARSTALSVAASMVLAAALGTPVSTFAATPAASAKTSKHAKAGKKPAAATKVSGKAVKAGSKGAVAKAAAADDDAPRASVKRKRVTYTSNGRHHSVVRRVAYEPRQPTVGQAFGL
ncbi:MAG: D-alanyl-D-alanine endopeptidase, partial [Paraburkholderia graminis]